MTLAERLRIALEATHDEGPILLAGDHYDFDPGTAGSPAAVLVAVTDRDDPGVILTQRTDTLRRHAGQIAFPGGRIDPEDDGPIAAALREAEEEIALPRSSVDVIGIADRYRTVTGYDVTPVIGVVPPALTLVPAEAEVADVFEVPLGFLLDHANHTEARTTYQGHERRYYEILWSDRRIWGATAAMIVNLSRRLRWTA
ncbi:CoA pyrophosphatase [Sphingomonas sp. JC676]|uniref:CoA pyrophosphatase n=1 Tax=Sphingomonas sp. JC676 TaxID=2768065 RepID=UPI0016586FDC|nr:CoA pyrophosphatase [Sphingomonas sp. JC676]MBC9031255.1 CoA pyrophosphatase [Sphingomonas sp. JC676]